MLRSVALMLLLIAACSSEAKKKPDADSDRSSEKEHSKKKKTDATDATPSARGSLSAEVAASATPSVAWPPAGMVEVAGGTLSVHGINDHLFPITVEDFALDAHEVTVADYRVCVTATKCKAPEDVSLNKGGCSFQHTDRENHPMNCVSPEEAEAYCASVGKRLPTAGEWQGAASAYGKRRFPWGDSAPTKETACWRSTDATCPVGTHAQGNTPDGIQDLAGNVAELLAERGCLGKPPAGIACLQPFAQTAGGAWNTFESDGLVAEHMGQTIGRPPESVGFRCAASKSKSSKPPELIPQN